MSEPFVGEIRMFGGNFAPRGWALCEGQILKISDNEGLFSLLGTIYGGDGRTTFGLPDLRGRLPMHAGDGPGMTSRRIGAKSGSETVGVSVDQLPRHTHALQASSDSAESTSPAQAVPARGVANIWSDDFDADPMAATAITETGGTDSHDNVMPFLVINFIISLSGIFPSRN